MTIPFFKDFARYLTRRDHSAKSRILFVQAQIDETIQILKEIGFKETTGSQLLVNPDASDIASLHPDRLRLSANWQRPVRAKGEPATWQDIVPLDTYQLYGMVTKDETGEVWVNNLGSVLLNRDEGNGIARKIVIRNLKSQPETMQEVEVEDIVVDGNKPKKLLRVSYGAAIKSNGTYSLADYIAGLKASPVVASIINNRPRQLTALKAA